jgi:hypothetical protein
MRKIALVTGLVALVLVAAALFYPRSAYLITNLAPPRFGQSSAVTTKTADVFVSFATNGERGDLPQLLARHPGLGASLAEGLAPLAASEGDLGSDDHVIANYRARHRLHYARHVLARHPGDAGRGGGADRGAGVRGEVAAYAGCRFTRPPPIRKASCP